MDKWKAEVLVKMKTNKITQRALAQFMGYTEEYVSMIFNGAKNPKDAEEKFVKAVDDMIALKV